MDNRAPPYLPPPGYLLQPNLAPPLQTPPLASPPLPHNHNPIFSAPHLLTLRNAVPAKRGSDEVQFVSSNPVKKRKLDGFSSPAPSPPLLAVRGAADASHHLPPLAQAPPVLPVAASIPTSAPYPQSEAGVSTTAFQQASGVETSHPDPQRGTSEPVLTTVDLSNMWTAPSRGPKSSPAVSPKQLPPQFPQTQMIPSLQRASQLELASDQSQPEQSLDVHGPIPSPSKTGKSSLPGRPQPTEKENSEARVPSTEPGVPGLIAQLEFRGLNMASGDSEQAVGTLHSGDPSGGTIKVDLPQLNQHERGTTGSDKASAAAQATTLTSEPVTDSITVATPQQAHETASQQTLQSPSSQPSFQGQQQAGNIQCQGGAQHSAKSKCYHCFQAWLSRTGTLMPQGNAVMTPAAKPQIMPYQAVYQQQWPQNHGMSNFTAPVQNAVTNGQLLRQHSPGTQQHASATSPAPVAPMMANMSNLSASTNMLQPSMWNAQSAGIFQNPQPAMRQPQPHPNGKHIIVDMAETCLESFPFEEFAQRHNQPPKRIREIFEAIIQMPLLRCPTDKRRAGKVATAKMKEYTQATKDLQAQMANGQTQNQRSMPQPSAWEMAQYMGPSNVPIPGHLAFPGPW